LVQAACILPSTFAGEEGCENKVAQSIQQR